MKYNTYKKKPTKYQRKQRNTEKAVLICLVLLFAISNAIYSKAIDDKVEDVIEVQQEIIEEVEELKVAEQDVESLIISIATANNFDVETALRIAKCESQLGKYKTNWQGSSAKGVYMFIDKTWANYCEGDVMNDKDNINCFIKLYNSHPNWWACQ